MPPSGGRRQPKGYEDRHGLDDETRALAEELRALAADPAARDLLRRLGVGEEVLESAAKATAEMDSLIMAPAEIAGPLAPLGWIPFDDVPLETYREAASLVTAGKVEEAEELITEKWNEPSRLARAPQRMFKLYYGDEAREALGRHRARLLHEALELHEAGRYAASISIVLAQIDGVFVDATGKHTAHFFAHNNRELVDDQTKAGHPDGLQALAAFMAGSMTVTAATGELTRHGILHGRELAYDTRRNSTKAFVALLALVEVAEARLKAQSEAAAAAREAHYAESKELDEDGRRLDRRGFLETKTALDRTSSFQFGFFKRHGRYASELAELDPGDGISRELDLQLAVSDAAEEFRAWIRTPTGVIFAVAGRGGNYVGWRYVGDNVPAGIDSPTDWRHNATDPSHVDW